MSLLLANMALLNPVSGAQLVGYWPFNGNANDESGNGNNGTVFGATLVNGRDGSPNGAYSFDGSTHIQTPIVSWPLEFTLSCWVRVTTTGSFMRIIGNEFEQGAELMYNAVPTTIRIIISDPGLLTDISGGTTNVGNWQWVAVTFDGSNTALYVDDPVTPVDSGVYSLGSLNSVIEFGRPVASTAIAGLKGDLDDIRIYDGVLSASVLTGLYNE